jgi:hypothetical protein
MSGRGPEDISDFFWPDLELVVAMLRRRTRF